MVEHIAIEPIYSKYSLQINAIVELLDHNYNKAAKVVSWLYGGSSERWRKVLASKKKTPLIPSEVRDLFTKIKK